MERIRLIKRKKSIYNKPIILIFFISIVFTFTLMGNTGSPLIAEQISYQRVLIEEGDTIWSLVASENPTLNITSLVNQTMIYNHLATDYLQPGQVIYIPVYE